jgi:transcriptional regulator with XRE-family HTH domain
MTISALQCRAARSLLDWSRETLATKAGVGLRTLVDFERGARSPHATTLEAVQQALEEAGVIFIAENGEGAGVRLKKSRPEEGRWPAQMTTENDG